MAISKEVLGVDAGRGLVVVKVCCSGDFSAVEFGDSETLNICYGEAGSYRMEPGRICQTCSLTHQRLAAWRTKVVRQTWAIAGKKWL